MTNTWDGIHEEEKIEQAIHKSNQDQSATYKLGKLLADVEVGRYGTKNRSELINRIQDIYLTIKK